MLPRLLMIVMFVGCGATVEGQSLGEAAAKEKERKGKKTAGSAKSYSESDLQEAADKRAKEGASSATDALAPTSQDGGDVAAKPAVAARAAGASPPSESDTARQKARGAEYKARLDAVNAQIKKAEEELAAAEKSWRMAEHHPWEMASTYEPARARFEAAKKTVQRLRSERDDIELAARREAIPPGYMR